MVLNETTIYDFVSPIKNYQRHLETRVLNARNIVQSHQ